MKIVTLLIAFLLASFSSGSFASAPAPWYSVKGAAASSSKSGACENYRDVLAASSPTVSWTSGVSGDFCNIYANGNLSQQQGFAPVMKCSDGSSPDTSKPTDQQCPDQCPPAGTSAGNVTFTRGWATGPDVNSAFAGGTVNPYESSFCQGQCLITGDAGGASGDCFHSQSPTNGYYKVTCSAAMKYTGANCTPSPSNSPDGPPPPSDPPPEKNRCPLGTKQTGTDSAGTPICTGDAPKPPATKDTTTTKTTNADGSTTETTTEKTTNGDGSETTKTTTKTTQPDGTSTTSENTTVGNKPGGGTGTDDSSDRERDDLCKRNPTLNICRNSSISGQCESISCDGDAIQCAIAREQATENCKRQAAEDTVKASSYHQAGVDALAGTGNADLPNPANVTPIDVGTLDSSGWLGGGSCFADKTISTAAGSFVIPLSQACDVLILFRYLFMFVASMLSFRILSRAFLGD